MPVAQTSLFAYADLQEVLNDRQRDVWGMLCRCREPVSNRELAKILRWDPCCVTGRMFELRQHGIVIHAGRRRCHVTHKIVNVWKPYEGALCLRAS